MSLTVEQVNEALAQVIDPNTDKDLLSSRSARNVRVDGGDVSVDVELGYPARSQIDPIRRAVIEAAGVVRNAPTAAEATPHALPLLAPTASEGHESGLMPQNADPRSADEPRHHGDHVCACRWHERVCRVAECEGN